MTAELVKIEAGREGKAKSSGVVAGMRKTGAGSTVGIGIAAEIAAETAAEIGTGSAGTKTANPGGCTVCTTRKSL